MNNRKQEAGSHPEALQKVGESPVFILTVPDDKGTIAGPGRRPEDDSRTSTDLWAAY